MTGQFGKNHLGDRDEHLPTVARVRRIHRQRSITSTRRKSRRTYYYFERSGDDQKKFGPRGIIHAWAIRKAAQKIEDTGPAQRGPHGDH